MIHKPQCPAKDTTIYTRLTGILSLSPIIGLQRYGFSLERVHNETAETEDLRLFNVLRSFFFGVLLCFH